jgi:hypothetical protein
MRIVSAEEVFHFFMDICSVLSRMPDRAKETERKEGKKEMLAQSSEVLLERRDKYLLLVIVQQHI